MNKTFIIESNNSSGKLLSDRSKKDAKISDMDIDEHNSSWETNLNMGVKLEEGDQLSISSVQINLRGDPNQTIEFSGDSCSQYENPLYDNIAAGQYGYYITNRHQYNMNLPLATHRIMWPQNWFQPEFGSWACEEALPPVEATTAVNWDNFYKSYPFLAYEGVMNKPTKYEWSPPGAAPAVTDPAGAILPMWDAIQTQGAAGTGLANTADWHPGNELTDDDQMRSGFSYCGDQTCAPLSNAPYSMAYPNNNRLYVATSDHKGPWKTAKSIADIHVVPPILPGASTGRRYADDFITNTIRLKVDEGFYTPAALGNKLSTAFHQRDGDANDWTNQEVEPHVYQHDSFWIPYNTESELPGPPPTGLPAPPLSTSNIHAGYFPFWTSVRQHKGSTAAPLPGGGGYDPANPGLVPEYNGRLNVTLRKESVADVTDKSYKTILTTGGRLMQKIYVDPDDPESLPEWRDGDSRDKWFGANIPGNPHWVWRDYRDHTADPVNLPMDGQWGANFKNEMGLGIFYNNLLVGDMNRYQSIITMNVFNYSQIYPAEQLCSRLNGGVWDDVMAAVNSKNFVLTDYIYLNSGQLATWDSGNYTYRAGSTDDWQGVFGNKVVLTDNYHTLADKWSDPEEEGIFKEYTYAGAWAGGEDGDDKQYRDTLIRKREEMDCMEPGTEFSVIPTNIVATPAAIARLKYALYRSREVDTGSEATVQSGTKDKTMFQSWVTKLDIGITDDETSINVDGPNGYPKPNGQNNRFTVPTPYNIVVKDKPLPGPTAYVPPASPNYGGGWSTYDSYLFHNTPLHPTGGSSMGDCMRYKVNNRQEYDYNKVWVKTCWNENMDPASPEFAQYLPTDTLFSFTDGNGNTYPYTDYFRPGGIPEETRFTREVPGTEIGGQTDGNAAGVDEGVGLCVVYYKKGAASTPGNPVPLSTAEVNLDVNFVAPGPTNINGIYPDRTHPAGPVGPVAVPGFGDNDPGNLCHDPLATKQMQEIPYLAFVVRTNPKRPYRERHVPIPQIGEYIGFSPAFSDGQYGQVVTTQRVNPKPYNSIPDSLKASNADYNIAAQYGAGLYYNIFDYYPYIHIGSTDPQIAFDANTGRFEITNMHTPAYASNGPWQDPTNEANTQASDMVMLMNSKTAFLSNVSLTSEMQCLSFQVTPFYNDPVPADAAGGWPRNLPAVFPLNPLPRAHEVTANPLNYNHNSDLLSVMPYGEITQHIGPNRIISAQSGIGLLNLYCPVGSDDINVWPHSKETMLLADMFNFDPMIGKFALSPWQPQVFRETLFSKMGYQIEQLIPMYGKSNNDFNRSNYNEYVGTNNISIEGKATNMIYPFTTNGYADSNLSFSCVTNNWLGYDTVGCMKADGSATPPPPFNTNHLQMNGRDDYPESTWIEWQTGNNATTHLKDLPPAAQLQMFSLGGNSNSVSQQATCVSDALIARDLPRKYNYSYMVIHSNIIEQQSNFISGSNKMLPIPAVGYLNRNYASADFFYSFDSDFTYTIDRTHVLNNFQVQLRLPNGQLARVDDNCSILFKLVKAIRPPLQLEPPKPPTKKEIEDEDKEEGRYVDSLL